MCRGCSRAIPTGTRSTIRTVAKAEATRRRVYDMLVADKMMVQGFHYPFPGLAYVEKARQRLSRDRAAVEPDDLSQEDDMTDVTRRGAPAAGRRAPGWYRYTVGDLEVTVVTDGARAFDLTPSYITNAPIEEVRKALDAAYMPPNRLIHHYAPIVINTGGKLVVVDTGGGPGAYKESKGEIGQFAENLVASGIDPKSIDMVVISHFHGDHVNGLLDASSKLAFPNAEVLVPEVEWKFWMDDGEMSRPRPGAWPDCSRTTAASSMRSGARSRPMAGARRSRRASCRWRPPAIRSATRRMWSHPARARSIVQSDVTNNPDLFARHPDWGGAFDQDPNEAVATRRKVYDMLVAEKLLVQGFHYPFPGLARVEKAGSGYRVIPAPWHPTL